MWLWPQAYMNFLCLYIKSKVWRCHSQHNDGIEGTFILIAVVGHQLLLVIWLFKSKFGSVLDGFKPTFLDDSHPHQSVLILSALHAESSWFSSCSGSVYYIVPGRSNINTPFNITKIRHLACNPLDVCSVLTAVLFACRECREIS